MRCNDWQCGDRGLVGLDAVGERRVTLAKVVTDGERVVVGKPETYTFPAGTLGVEYGYKKVTEEVFRQAYKQAKRLRKAR